MNGAENMTHHKKKKFPPVLDVPFILNKGTFTIYKKWRICLMRVTIVMGNHYISVIWKILKILNILMRTLYLMLSVSLDSGENASNDKVNESVVEVGRCGSNLTHGHNLSHFRLSCACLVCCLRKST